MKVAKMFPTPHLRGEDLNGMEPNVKIVKFGTVKAFNSDTAKEEDKWAVWFFGKDKYFLLNKTNTETIAGLLGDDTDEWIGKRIKLYATPVSAFGKMHNAIRVKPADAKKTAEELIDEIHPEYDDDEVPPGEDFLD